MYTAKESSFTCTADQLVPQTGASKQGPHVVPWVLDSCRPVQEALCACSEKKKMGSLSQWGFCYLSWGAQETQTKYLDPLCLKYLGIALDTMSTHASSVRYSSQLPFCPQHFFFSP